MAAECLLQQTGEKDLVQDNVINILTVILLCHCVAHLCLLWKFNSADDAIGLTYSEDVALKLGSGVFNLIYFVVVMYN